MTSSLIARLALGTAQFGLSYGVSNTGGQVPDAQVKTILKAAAAAGVDMLDTAAAYGDAESIVARAAAGLGHPFLMVSKTPPGAGIDAVNAAVRRSAELAGGNGLDTILVHHPKELAGQAGDRLWRALHDLANEGAAHRIGLSASFDDNPKELATRFSPSVIQLPVSLFDQRLVRDGTLAELAARGIEIHARSIFLQGLLFATAQQLSAPIRHIAPGLEARRKLIVARGVSLVEAATAYVLAQPEIRRVVVGVTGLPELNEVLTAAAASPADLPWADIAIDDPIVLNPSRWQIS
ncbi:aryl-alcohol dehydrogenase-like predicted oxidoreductase [Bradyrhizobium sp. GM24.11]